MTYLTAAEERELLLAYRERGDQKARDRLITCLLPFVRFRAGKLSPRQNPYFEDLVQQGTLGLMLAIDKYDLSYTTPLIFYARNWIDVYIQRMREPRIDDRLRFFKLSPDCEQGPSDYDRDNEFDPADEGPLPDEQLESFEHGRELRRLIGRLGKRLGPLGREVVTRRLLADEPETLEQVGIRCGVSRESVRLCEKRVRALLARYLASFRAGRQ